MPVFDKDDIDFQPTESLPTTKEIKPENRYQVDDLVPPKPANPWAPPPRGETRFNPLKHNGRVYIVNHRVQQRVTLLLQTSGLVRGIHLLTGNHELDPLAWTQVGIVDRDGPQFEPDLAPFRHVLEHPDSYVSQGIEVIAELRCRECNAVLLGEKQKEDGICTDCRISHFDT